MTDQQLSGLYTCPCRTDTSYGNRERDRWKIQGSQLFQNVWFLVRTNSVQREFVRRTSTLSWIYVCLSTELRLINADSISIPVISRRLLGKLPVLLIPIPMKPASCYPCNPARQAGKLLHPLFF